MRALITGVGGFAGQYLAEHLAQTTGWELWGTVRGEASGQPGQAGDQADIARRSHVPGRSRLDEAKAREIGLKTAPLELADYAATKKLIADLRPDYIFHLAAQAIVQHAFSDPEATLVNNLVGTLHVLQAVRELDLPGTTMLLVGSGEEYGHIHPEDLPIDEDTPLRPENPYAVSKVSTDMLGLQYFLAYKLRIVRVRPFNHIGPGQSEHFVTAAFARQIAMIEAGLQEPVVRVGNLSAERDFTDVRDMVRAYYLAASEGEPGEVYNLGSGQVTSIQRILDTLLELSNVPVTVERDPARLRPADVPRIVCDPSRFRKRTGWQPEVPLRHSLADILDYWRERTLGELAAKEQKA